MLLILIAFSLSMFILFVGSLCKVEIQKDKNPELDAEGNVVKKKTYSDFWDIFKNLTSIDWGLLVSFVAEFSYTVNVGGFESLQNSKDISVDAVLEVAIFTVAQIVGFVIFFYVIYGILSLVNFHGNNEQARRNTAIWITVAIDLFLVLSLPEV